MNWPLRAFRQETRRAGWAESRREPTFWPQAPSGEFIRRMFGMVTSLFAEHLPDALVQIRQELLIIFCLGHRGENRLHRLHAALLGQRAEHAAHHHDGAQRLLIQKLLLAARAAAGDVNGGEDAAVGEL